VRDEQVFGRHGDLKPENILWSDDSHGGFLEITDEWKHLRALYKSILSLYTKLTEKRAILREKRRKKYQVDESYIAFCMQHARDIISKNTLPTGLEGLLQSMLKDCQDAGDECGPLEEE
jgi:hypothetical protein